MQVDLLGVAVLARSFRRGLERGPAAVLVLEVDEGHPQVKPLLLFAEGNGLQRSLAHSSRTLFQQDTTIRHAGYRTQDK